MRTTAARPRWRYAGYYFLVWTLFGLFLFSRDVTRRLYWNDPTRWEELLASWLVGSWVSAALTPAVVWLAQRFPIERRGWIRHAPIHLVCAVIFSILQITGEAAILSHFGILSGPAVSSFHGLFQVLAVLGFHGNVLSYGAIVGIQFAVCYYQQYRAREQDALRLELHTSELKTQLVHAQLNALKMQLQPHFLFNTLNAVVVLVRQQKGQQAEEMLGHLGDLLRGVLEDVESQEVPLRRELEYLQLYLAIEQVRFQDRLRVDFAIDDRVLDAGVPHLGLQPLVENAIRHGLERRADAGRIHIRAARVDGRLEIIVEDDGPGFAPNAAEGRGIGLANTRARLHQLYGDEATLITRNRDQGGAAVTMALPYRVAEHDVPSARD